MATTRRRFLQTLAAAPTVAAVPMLWAMEVPEAPEPFDGAEYNCGLLWVEADFSVYIHTSIYSWQEWDVLEKKLVRKQFMIKDFTLPGQCEFICPDPKYAIPFIARNGRGALVVYFNHGHKRNNSIEKRTWALNDMQKVDDNKAYHRRVIVA